MQLRFLSHVAAKAPEHPGFWLSLAQAIASAAAEVLEVPESELASYVAPSSQANSTIIYLYDAVPGGAGLVRQLGQENLLHTVLVVARQRVDGGCGCGEDTSCYGCLRTYRNQYAHTLLARGPVYDFLSQVLAEWRSTNR